MAYIEENLKIRSKPKDDSDDEDKGPPDPQEALYRLADRWKVDKQKPTPDDGSVTNSLTMLTAIPEVDLGMEYVANLMTTHTMFLIITSCTSARLKNIEETEKAKRVVAEERQDRKRTNNDEEHLAASRCELVFVSPLSQSLKIILKFIDQTSKQNPTRTFYETPSWKLWVCLHKTTNPDIQTMRGHKWRPMNWSAYEYSMLQHQLTISTTGYGTF